LPDQHQFQNIRPEVYSKGRPMKGREMLQTLGAASGFGHELGGRPDVIMPILRRFLDPILLR